MCRAGGLLGYRRTYAVLSSSIIVCALFMIMLLEEREILTMFFLGSLAGSTLCVLLLKQRHRLHAFFKSANNYKER
jgi:hypothetical protein